jgi:ABC-type branched-subunit amino acid transport system ATPase component
MKVIPRPEAESSRLWLVKACSILRGEKSELAAGEVGREFSPTMIWIEHDIQLVRDLADKVLVLHYGKELALGPPNQVLSDPAVIAAYIGKR